MKRLATGQSAFPLRRDAARKFAIVAKLPSVSVGLASGAHPAFARRPRTR